MITNDIEYSNQKAYKEFLSKQSTTAERCCWLLTDNSLKVKSHISYHGGNEIL